MTDSFTLEKRRGPQWSPARLDVRANGKKRALADRTDPSGQRGDADWPGEQGRHVQRHVAKWSPRQLWDARRGGDHEVAMVTHGVS